MTDSDRIERAASMPPPLAVGGRIKRRTVLAWGLWDWGSSAYSAVITSFVFGPYVVRGVVGDTEPGGLSADTWLGISTATAGILVAAIAPITGQRADASGHRKRSLAIWSGLVIAVMLGMFSVRNDPSYLWIALLLLAAGAVFQEFAVVSYNAMLPQVSTPDTIGRVSGFGWAMGYIGGIFLLLICYVGFIAPDVGWFGRQLSWWSQYPCRRCFRGPLVRDIRDSGAPLLSPSHPPAPSADGWASSPRTGCSSTTSGRSTGATETRSTFSSHPPSTETA